MTDREDNERRKQDRRRGKENEQIIDQLHCRQWQEAVLWSVIAAAAEAI